MKLKLRGATFSYQGGAEPIFKDASFILPEKGLIYVRGPNGSGKTTLLKVLGGKLRLTAGEMLVDNTDILYMSATDLAAFEAAVYRPEPSMYEPSFSMLENVLFLARESDPARGRTRVEELLSQFFVLSVLKTPWSKLSRGQQKLLDLVLYRLEEKPIAVFDEPLSYLDAEHRLEALNILRDYANRALVIAADNLPIDAAYCDLTLTLEAGRIERGVPQ